MPAELVISNVIDPVYVGTGAFAENIELRIGESVRGKSRIALISPSEARKVAIALLQSAQLVEERESPLPKAE
jgi:hypothetical protein